MEHGQSFAHLANHGVDSEAISAIMRWFGPALPKDRSTTTAAVQWALEQLPWHEVHPMIATRFDRLRERTCNLHDERLDLVRGLLTDVPNQQDAALAAVACEEMTYAFASQLGRMHARPDGSKILVVNVASSRVGRLWFASRAIAAAALCVDHAGVLDTSTALSEAAWIALVHLTDPASAGVDKAVRLDGLVIDVFGGLSRFVGGWTLAWI